MTEKFERTKDEQKRCVEMHDSFRDDLLKRQLSNNENYDKAILSLSSAALALSLTAIKFIVPLEQAEHVALLQLSWYLFLLTVILSLSAYLISNHAITKQLKIAHDYYIDALVQAEDQRNIFAFVNKIANYLTGLTFVIALALVVTFVTLNMNGDENMSKDKKTGVVTQKNDSQNQMISTPNKDKRTTASADVPRMELAPGTKKPPVKDAKPK